MTLWQAHPPERPGACQSVLHRLFLRVIRLTGRVWLALASVLNRREQCGGSINFACYMTGTFLNCIYRLYIILRRCAGHLPRGYADNPLLRCYWIK